MTKTEAEVLLLVAEILDLTVRRPDDNAIDAIDLLRGLLSAWAERGVRSEEIRRSVDAIYVTLGRTPRGARPGAFLRRYERRAFG